MATAGVSTKATLSLAHCFRSAHHEWTGTAGYLGYNRDFEVYGVFFVDLKYQKTMCMHNDKLMQLDKTAHKCSNEEILQLKGA